MGIERERARETEPYIQADSMADKDKQADAYIHTGKQDTQTERQTGKHTCIQGDSNAYRETVKQTERRRER